MKSNLHLLALLGTVTIYCSTPNNAQSSPSSFLWNLNKTGFSTFIHEGYSMTPHPSDGELGIFNRTPVFEGEEYKESPAPEVASSGNNITLTFPWGEVKGTYTGTEAGVNITIQVKNNTETTLNEISVQVVRLTYNTVAQIAVGEKEPEPFDGGVWPVFDLADTSGHATVVQPEGEIRVSAAGGEPGVAGFFFAEEGGIANRIAVHFNLIPAGESRETTLTVVCESWPRPSG